MHVHGEWGFMWVIGLVLRDRICEFFPDTCADLAPTPMEPRGRHLRRLYADT